MSDDWDASLAVSSRTFEAQMKRLAERGYRGVTFTEAARRPEAAKLVAVTFDDGFRSVYDSARPVLERYGFPATVFVPTALVGRTESLSWPGVDHWAGTASGGELESMSSIELRALVDAGWEIGSHTRTHQRLPGLDEAALKEELEVSRAECAELTGSECTSIAFPYGAVDGRVIVAAEHAGYAAAALLSSDLVRPSHFAKERVGVYRVDGSRSFAVKTSPWLLRAPPRFQRQIRGFGRRMLFR